MKALLNLIIFISLASCGQSQVVKTENVILITYDGLRWQELFGGIDTTLLNDSDYTPEGEVENLRNSFWDPNPQERRKLLFPFFWKTLSPMGQLHGNRLLGSKVDVTNGHWFSYPGYNEILAGLADDQRIKSNDKLPNPNQTVLELVNNQPEYAGKVAAFGSWDVFPYIINEERSGVPVNAGFEPYSGDSLSIRISVLNQLLEELPKPWSTVRNDAFTYHFAMEFLKQHQPRLLYISFGETDDYAHEGHYNRYLQSAYQTDRYIGELWDWLQSEDQYRDQTTLIITTDHGRGTVPKETWRHHGTKIDGSGQIWVAVLGPDTRPVGEIASTEQLYQNQVASTIAYLLGVPFEESDKRGRRMETVTR